MNWTLTFDMLRLQAQNFSNSHALVNRDDGVWTALSSLECLKIIDLYSRVLLSLGLKSGDMLLVLPTQATAEWILLDQAAQQTGIIVVPIHATSQPYQFAHIAIETEAKVCFFADRESQDRFLANENEKLDLKSYYLFGKEGDKNSLQHLLEKVKEDDGKWDLEEMRNHIQPSDLSCIIYTSGTTGIPKGVMLTHENIVSNVKSVLTLLPLSPKKRAVSFLPYSHIFERTTIYCYLATGISLYLPGNREVLLEAFKEVKPHYFTAVPRILEKMYEQLIAYRTQGGWFRENIVGWALGIGKRYKESSKMSPLFYLKRQIAKWLVFNRFRHISGGKVEAILTGAAYLRPDIGRTFAAAGIRVREGYGMTETSPVVTMNRFQPGLNRFGTVGLPIPGVEVHIDQPDETGEGEILVRGPNVMKGYYKRPSETAEVLSDDGWLRTGDVGKFVHKRFLQITDRRKDIFKTSSGKYVAPMLLENHFSQSNYIEQIMIVGFQKPFIIALIKPNFDLLKVWCEDHQIHWTSPQYMVLNIRVRQKIMEEIEKLNESLPNYERIRGIHLFHEEWTTESGHLTYTLKLVRTKILEDNAKAIKALYQH